MCPRNPPGNRPWGVFRQVTVQPSVDGGRVSYEFNSALTLCTRREHLVPQVKGSIPQDWPRADANPMSGLPPALLNKL